MSGKAISSASLRPIKGLRMKGTAEDRRKALAESNEMAPVQGTVDVDIPIANLWEAFTHANWWPRWNKCFFWMHNRSLVAGQKLLWAFQPIRWYYLYKMFAIANIVEVEEQRRVTWEVTAMPGFYARHTYHMEDLGNGRSRFGSWERAMGGQIRFAPTRHFWIVHFTFVKDKSLDGAQALERIYKRDGGISEAALIMRHGWRRVFVVLMLLFILTGVVLGARFYTAYVRLAAVDISPGVTAVLGGGGNTTIVEDSGQLLVIDTKFPPGSLMLHRLITTSYSEPVSMIINTHYHYDHTQGNVQYPGVAIYAYHSVPALMRIRDGTWWTKHNDAIPTVLIGDRGAVKLGTQTLLLVHPGPAHTQGDLYIVFSRGGRTIVATGDIVFNTYYPMMDLGEGGMDLDGLIAANRALAEQYPRATFIPGHGPVATARDLVRYATYLEAIRDQVAAARRAGASEDAIARGLNLSSFNLSPLPTFHNDHLCWSGAEIDTRWVYQLEAGTRFAREECTF